MTPEAIANTYRRDVDPNADVTTLTTLIRQAQGMALRRLAEALMESVRVHGPLGMDPMVVGAIAGLAVELAEKIEAGR